MENYNNDEVEINLRDLFYLIKSKLWIILLSGIIMASAAGLYSSFLITPVYTSTTKLYILSKTTTLSSLADLQIGSQLTQDYMVLVKSRPVVTQVIENLGLNMSYEEMVGIITPSNPSNTRILAITANYTDPYLAKKIVDEFATVSATQIAEIMDADKPTIVEEGYMQSHPSSPNTKMNIVIGGVLGVFIASGIIILLNLLDDTIKDSDDIERYLGMTTLALIPIESGAAKLSKQDEKNRKKRKKSKQLKDMR
ncbi:YveK family protein [Anaerocolumna sp.]|uniref:YveK family protein n=1 Tax=Anaerocolumna sp. TaxID=2041569 RepID=UPI0028AD3538|nr:Wzz/FepE/Etk N-terminal domain-containing protein [Anaerocolumna sp.]